MNSRNTYTICFITVLLMACSRDNFSPPVVDCNDTFTYTEQIRQIINGSCAYSGCHDGGGGIGPGNYTNYAGLFPDLNSGKFRERVINQKDDPIIGMPPDTLVYAQSIKSDLNSEELDMITCWLEQGFPEN